MPAPDLSWLDYSERPKVYDYGDMGGHDMHVASQYIPHAGYNNEGPKVYDHGGIGGHEVNELPHDIPEMGYNGGPQVYENGGREKWPTGTL